MKTQITVGVLLLTSVASSAAMAADLFVNAQWGFYKGDMGAVALQPTHPVTTTTGGNGSDQDDALTLQIGYMFGNGWYGAVGRTSIGPFVGYQNHSGTDGTFNYNSNIRHQEKVQTWALTLGKSFPIAHGFALFGEVGVHRFEKDVTERNEVLTTEIANTANTTLAVVSNSSTVNDTGALYTLGWSMELHRGAVFSMSYTDFAELDWAGTNVGLALRF